ncbi:hypothetical protein FACS1894111_10150 [Clostridia bacterium]|nr:hypothetical protein FACS1894111_10150 [Clostridia bacterium]
MNEKQAKAVRLGIKLLFIIYAATLCYFLFFAGSMGRTYSERRYHYNLVLFKEIRRFYIHRDILGNFSVILNLLGNVVAFLPLGFLYPILSRKMRSFLAMTFLAFECSLAAELIQLIFRVGCFDVDDLLLNTVGGAIGYIGYLGVRRWWCHQNRASKCKKE